MTAIPTRRLLCKNECPELPPSVSVSAERGARLIVVPRPPTVFGTRLGIRHELGATNPRARTFGSPRAHDGTSGTTTPYGPWEPESGRTLSALGAGNIVSVPWFPDIEGEPQYLNGSALPPRPVRMTSPVPTRTRNAFFQSWRRHSMTPSSSASVTGAGSPRRCSMINVLASSLSASAFGGPAVTFRLRGSSVTVISSRSWPYRWILFSVRYFSPRFRNRAQSTAPRIAVEPRIASLSSRS